MHFSGMCAEYAKDSIPIILKIENPPPKTQNENIHYNKRKQTQENSHNESNSRLSSS